MTLGSSTFLVVLGAINLGAAVSFVLVATSRRSVRMGARTPTIVETREVV